MASKSKRQRGPPAANGSAAGRSYWIIVRTNLFGFFNLLLFAVGAILGALGRYNDAFITVVVAVTSALIRTFQELRAKRQLDRIALLVRPQATVIRGDVARTVTAAELVKGDVIHLGAGDQALADGTVESGEAELDESLLTGESDLVHKRRGDWISSGSFCVTGALRYTAEAVGADSAANRLAAIARNFTESSTPFQQQVALVIRLLMVLTGCMALLFFIGGVLRGSALPHYIAASAVLVGLVPYGLFLTISLAYTLGAVKLARSGALVQHAHVVEALNYIDVVCLDKTGTLTTNALQVNALLPLGGLTRVELTRLVGDFARSVSETNATTDAIVRSTAGRQRTPVDEVRFASIRKWSALAFEGDDGLGGSNWGHGVFVLGAPEVLGRHLTADDESSALAQQTRAWSDQGLRVLLFAGIPDVSTLHTGAGEPSLPPLRPLGLVSLRDELRPHAREMLSQFAEMGISLKIISGDNPYTAAALARQLGVVALKPVAGAELAAMTATEFERSVEEATVFGRVSPEQKAQVLDTLVKRGHYAAMVGDGVNDILALKKAKLGIAVQSGSNATRNVADMVLLEDSYAALAPALSESKRVITGLTNAAYLLLARSLTYAFVIIGALMVGLDLPFEPAQMGVTAITVGLPSLFLILWARPQAKPEPLLASLARFVIPVAVWSSLIGVAIYAIVHLRLGEALQASSLPPAAIARFEQYTGLTFQADAQFGLTAFRIVAQTALSVFLSLGALILIVFLEPPVAALASWRPVSDDRWPAWLTASLTVLFLAGLCVPWVGASLGFVPPMPGLWALIASGLVVWGLGLTLLWRKRWIERLLALEV